MSDARQMIAALMSRPLGIADMRSYINRTPYLQEANQGQSIVPPSPLDRTMLPEAAAVADPFGIMQLQRLLGMDVNPQRRLNESHGLANNEALRIHEQGRRR